MKKTQNNKNPISSQMNLLLQKTALIWPVIMVPLAEATQYASLSDFQTENTGIIVLVWVFGLLMAYGIGANDVANCFATSVGSGSLTLRPAVVAASFCEVFGAIFLSKSVTDTVRKKMIDVAALEQSPDVVLYIMFSALVGASIWLILCSSVGLPVSTTHSIIGGIIGAGCSVNTSLVSWDNVLNVVISWFTSPFLSALLGGFCFSTLRSIIMREDGPPSLFKFLANTPHERAIQFFPLLLWVCFSSLLNFIGFKNSEIFGWDLKGWRTADSPNSEWALAGSCMGIGLVLTIITYVLTIKKLKQAVEDTREKSIKSINKTVMPVESAAKFSGKGTSSMASEASETALNEEEKNNDKLEKPGILKYIKKIGKQDVHKRQNEGMTGEIHQGGEQFTEETEATFHFLQVVSACFDSIAHGSNDVANALGPLAACYMIYRDGEMATKTPVPEWLTIIAGLGISLGVLTYGYHVIETIGVRLTKITATRGFSIEMGSSWVVIGGSLVGLPLSTTHCQVGATVGVGMTEAKVFGGRYDPHPEIELSKDQLEELCQYIDGKTGQITENFRLDENMEVKKGWKVDKDLFIVDEKTNLVTFKDVLSVQTIKFITSANCLTGVHWSLFSQIIAGWVFTLVFAGMVSAAICSVVMGIYQPVVGPGAPVALDSMTWDSA
jgi:sodium-dependent phosphate transporter